MTLTVRQLLNVLPQRGRVEAIHLRPARRAAAARVTTADARIGSGLDGDRFSGRPQSKRQVTLIQAEHIEVVARLLGLDAIDPGLLRRNLVVAGINLLALRNAQFRVGTALLEGTGACHPCSAMEKALGAGGFNAMRGHGGITARVIEPGHIAVGDEVSLVSAARLPADER